jgi:hypothetical protein
MVNTQLFNRLGTSIPLRNQIPDAPQAWESFQTSQQVSLKTSVREKPIENVRRIDNTYVSGSDVNPTENFARVKPHRMDERPQSIVFERVSLNAFCRVFGYNSFFY